MRVGADPTDYAEWRALAVRFSGLRAWAMEDSGGHGAGLARHLIDAGEFIVELVRSARRAGGYCLPKDQQRPDEDTFNGLPILGGLNMVADAVVRYEVDTVAVLPSPELDGPALRQLGWQLKSTEAELLLAPAITEIVGPRVRIRPVSGLPPMHTWSAPSCEGSAA